MRAHRHQPRRAVVGEAEGAVRGGGVLPEVEPGADRCRGERGAVEVDDPAGDEDPAAHGRRLVDDDVHGARGVRADHEVAEQGRGDPDARRDRLAAGEVEDARARPGLPYSSGTSMLRCPPRVAPVAVRVRTTPEGRSCPSGVSRVGRGTATGYGSTTGRRRPGVEQPSGRRDDGAGGGPRRAPADHPAGGVDDEVHGEALMFHRRTVPTWTGARGRGRRGCRPRGRSGWSSRARGVGRVRDEVPGAARPDRDDVEQRRGGAGRGADTGHADVAEPLGWHEPPGAAGVDDAGRGAGDQRPGPFAALPAHQPRSDTMTWALPSEAL